jgi:hypothetical protein
MRSRLTTALAAIALAVSFAPAGPAPDTVYITKSGDCYHRSSCSSLRKSSIAIDRADAVAQGYRACKRCKP